MTQQQDNSNDGQEKKIIIDDDWKQEAEADKKRLAEEQETAKHAEPGKLPEVSFSTLVSSFLTQALLSLGLIEHPSLGKPAVDLDMAKFNIDMLALLEEKTKGNLTEDEQRLLNEALHQVRMVYVQLAAGQASGLGM